MNRKLVVASIIMLLLLAYSLPALSLSGKKLSPIAYLPGTTIVNHYTISGTEFPVKVSVDPGPFTNITVTPVIDNEFDLIIHFPESEQIPPGNYNFGLTATENPPGSEGQINTLISVSKMFLVDVYLYEKSVRVSLSAPNINEGNNVTFQLAAQSVGYPNISSVEGTITVYDNKNALLGTLMTDKKPLPGLQSVVFTKVFDARGLTAGNYWAKALVLYDGKQETANTSFLIGNMDIIVKNYTSTFTSGYADFSVAVVNNWGDRLRNVYAKLLINEVELIQTPSIDLDAWQEGVLTGIVRIDLEPGTYAGVLKIFFEGEVKEVPVSISVILPPVAVVEQVAEKEIQRARSLVFIPAIITALIIITIVALYLLAKAYKRASREEEDEI